ncbi:cobalamin-binding protein [Alkalimonas sp.]|uniref:cobalamin-binding protein n=1 Tax=Alkalimonas sp. TaxID=1872453 RepID=UPI00263B0076|nr:cobalamin-binding protein [Alkalimonas sp.]MCC5825285.1 cobalamin-binding protein [Alkalimonas sp.]
MRFLWALLIIGLATSVQARPERIIALAPHITELLFDIGAGEQLVAVSDFSDYPEAAKALPSVANYAHIQLEAVLALKPDLVIAWRTGNPQADLHRLKQLGVTVVYSDPLLLEDVAKELRQLGALTGHLQQAEALAQRYEQELAALRSRYQQQAPVRVFFAMSQQPLSTIANKAWPQQILELCGADNPFAVNSNDYPQLGPEQLMLANPELIIQPTKGARPILTEQWQRFSSLEAVRKQQFLTVDADLMYRFSRRSLDGAKALCEGIDQIRAQTAP